jgi:ketosteroid isomerase-like protein
MMIRKLKQSCVTMALVAPPFLPGASAVAGPLDDAKARAHLDAVAASDVEALMRDYAGDAYLEWVGGPLDGRYRGKAEIRAVWQKFIAANAGKPRPARQFANAQSNGYEAHQCNAKWLAD